MKRPCVTSILVLAMISNGCTQLECNKSNLVGTYEIHEKDVEVLRGLGMEAVRPRMQILPDMSFTASFMPTKLFKSAALHEAYFSGSGNWECDQGTFFLLFSNNTQDTVSFTPEIGLLPSIEESLVILSSPQAYNGQRLRFVRVSK